MGDIWLKQRPQKMKSQPCPNPLKSLQRFNNLLKCSKPPPNLIKKWLRQGYRFLRGAAIECLFGTLFDPDIKTLAVGAVVDRPHGGCCKNAVDFTRMLFLVSPGLSHGQTAVEICPGLALAGLLFMCLGHPVGIVGGEKNRGKQILCAASGKG